MTSENWSSMNREKRVETIRFYLVTKLWSRRQLAEHFGITVDMISGMCTRNHIKVEQERKPPRLPMAGDIPTIVAAIKVPANAKGEKVNTPDYYGFLRDPDLKTLESGVWKPLTGSSPVALTQHSGYGKCRWPVAGQGHSMCNEPVKPGRVYCPAHCAIAYVKPHPPRKRKKATVNG